jgi:hypothetical protein
LIFRLALEGAMVTAGKTDRKSKTGTGTHGYGRIGADFWQVLKDKRGSVKTLVDRYNPWGSLSLRNAATAILSAGPDGPIPTVKLAMIRENTQEVEARIFIEKALTDKDKRAKLGEELAAKYQKMLDDRVLGYLRAVEQGTGGLIDQEWFLADGWQKRSEMLYEAAAKVAEKLK